jgi:HSP20 family molecular chaperone IbpA
MSSGRFPPLKWAQTAEAVLVTIDLADAENVEVDINGETNCVVFSANRGD